VKSEKREVKMKSNGENDMAVHVTNLRRNWSRMMATMKAHPVSMGTWRKAVGLEMHL